MNDRYRTPEQLLDQAGIVVVQGPEEPAARQAAVQVLLEIAPALSASKMLVEAELTQERADGLRALVLGAMQKLSNPQANPKYELAGRFFRSMTPEQRESFKQETLSGYSIRGGLAESSMLTPRVQNVCGTANVLDRDGPRSVMDVQVSGFQPIRASELARRPLVGREWIVPDFIPAGVVTSLYGDGGKGKSLLALQLAVCCETGTHFLGRPTKKVPVLYLAAEDDEAEIHRRLVGVCLGLDVRLPEIDNLHIESLAEKQDAALVEERDGRLRMTALYDATSKWLPNIPGGLLIVDTAADAFDGNEVDKRQVRSFIRALRAMAAPCGVTVLLLAHPSQSGMNSKTGMSGNVAWNNSVRSRLYFTGEMYVRKLEVKKSNYGPTGQTISMEYRNGTFVAVEEQASGPIAARLRQQASETMFLELLDLYARTGRRVHASAARGSAASEFAEHEKGKAFTKNEYKAAQDRLLEAGTIELQDEGPQSRRRTFLVRCGEATE